jgi:hypothetical protein
VRLSVRQGIVRRDSLPVIQIAEGLCARLLVRARADAFAWSWAGSGSIQPSTIHPFLFSARLGKL